MIASSIAAIIALAVVVTLVVLVHGSSSLDGAMPVRVLILSALHFLFLGLPALMIIRWLRKLSLFSVVSVGVFTAIVPSAMQTWPMLGESSVGVRWSKLFGTMVNTAIDGVPTILGWLNYLENLILVGVFFGMPSAVSFWLFYKE